MNCTVFFLQKRSTMKTGDADVFPWKIGAGEDWIRNGMEAYPGDQIYHCQGSYIYYVSIIWTFSHPPTNVVSMNTILNVSKIGHFLNPSIRTQSPFYSATSIFAVCRNLVQEIWLEKYGSRNQVREKWLTRKKGGFIP